MQYIVEISYMNGDDVAEQEHSQIESTDPLTVPNVGDSIYVQSGGGADYKQAQMLEVKHRRFTFIREMHSSETAIHVQLFCENIQ